MSLSQLSAGIVAGVFSLTTIGSELMLATDKIKEAWQSEAKSFVSTKDKSRKDDKQSPWATRQMIPGGPKF